MSYMTKMAVMPIYRVKTFKKLLLQKWTDGLCTLVCSNGFPRTTKIVQMMTWVDIDLLYCKDKNGKMLIHRILWKVLKMLALNGNKCCIPEYMKMYQ